MAKESLMNEEIRVAIGKETEPYVIEVEERVLKRLIDAVGDPNPLWQNEEYAKKTSYGGRVAPPSLLISVMASGGRISTNFPPVINYVIGDDELQPEPPLTNVLDGGGAWEFLMPIRPGDVITSKTKLEMVEEKRGKVGNMLLLHFTTTHVNQNGELVGRSYGTLIGY